MTDTPGRKWVNPTTRDLWDFLMEVRREHNDMVGTVHALEQVDFLDRHLELLYQDLRTAEERDALRLRMVKRQAWLIAGLEAMLGSQAFELYETLCEDGADHFAAINAALDNAELNKGPRWAQDRGASDE